MKQIQDGMLNYMLYGNFRGERPVGESIMSNAMTASECGSPSLVRARSLTERLGDEKAKLEERLAGVNNVLNQLKSDPKTQKLIDAISELGHF